MRLPSKETLEENMIRDNSVKLPNPGFLLKKGLFSLITSHSFIVNNIED